MPNDEDEVAAEFPSEPRSGHDHSRTRREIRLARWLLIAMIAPVVVLIVLNLNDRTGLLISLCGLAAIGLALYGTSRKRVERMEHEIDRARRRIDEK